jgi:hypothetical protein
VRLRRVALVWTYALFPAYRLRACARPGADAARREPVIYAYNGEASIGARERRADAPGRLEILVASDGSATPRVVGASRRGRACSLPRRSPALNATIARRAATCSSSDANS